MKKVFLMLSVSLFSLEAEAQECVDAPSCTDLGYTQTEADCPNGSVKCPWNTSLVFCGTIAEQKCAIGDIYYTDNTCLPAYKHDSSKTVLGVVVYVTDGGKHGQIMAPWWVDGNGLPSSFVYTKLAWGGYGTDISTLPNYTNIDSVVTDYDSCGNTDKIVAAGTNRTYPAAWATRYYAPTPETNGKWCLPAAGILRNIQNNQTAINTALNKVCGASNMLNYWVWSSSEYSNFIAWNADLGSSGLGGTGKNYNNDYVVPVLEF